MSFNTSDNFIGLIVFCFSLLLFFYAITTYIKSIEFSIDSSLSNHSTQSSNHLQSNNENDNNSCPINKVCLSVDEYQQLKNKKEYEVIDEKPITSTHNVSVNNNKETVTITNNTIEQQLQPINLNSYQQISPDINMYNPFYLPPSFVQQRDMYVMNDQLYPPLNRIDALTHNAMNYHVANRNMYVPINDIGDTYRLVGYITSDEVEHDKGGNSWKLFARQKDRHTSDFYIVPSNRNYDIKIPIKDDMVVGTRLRDIYTIPNEISFKSPFLHKSPYTFIEMSKTDYSSPFYN